MKIRNLVFVSLLTLLKSSTLLIASVNVVKHTTSEKGGIWLALGMGGSFNVLVDTYGNKQSVYNAIQSLYSANTPIIHADQMKDQRLNYALQHITPQQWQDGVYFMPFVIDNNIYLVVFNKFAHIYTCVTGFTGSNIAIKNKNNMSFTGAYIPGQKTITNINKQNEWEIFGVTTGNINQLKSNFPKKLIAWMQKNATTFAQVPKTIKIQIKGDVKTPSNPTIQWFALNTWSKPTPVKLDNTPITVPQNAVTVKINLGNKQITEHDFLLQSPSPYYVIESKTIKGQSRPVLTAALEANRAQLKELNAILQKDNYTQLKTFIQNNTSFNWNVLTNINWKKETSTPLITAVLYNAYKCTEYLLEYNIGNIRNSMNTKSSHNLLPKDYTLKNPKHYHSNNEVTQMQNLLKKYSI